jgi:hypothetical protein
MAVLDEVNRDLLRLIKQKQTQKRTLSVIVFREIIEFNDYSFEETLGCSG